MALVETPTIPLPEIPSANTALLTHKLPVDSVPSTLISVGQIVGLLTVPTIAALKDAQARDGMSINVSGYYAVQDGGGGVFQFVSASTDTPDNGLVIQPNAGTGRWKRIYPGATINVKWFGARGDNATNDGTPITAAIAAVVALISSSSRPVLYFPPAAGYRISAGITIPAAVDILMDGPLSYSASGTALTVGAVGSLNINAWLKLNVIRATQSTWADGSVGIKLINCYTSTIYIVEASQFQEGVQCIGDGVGFVYNEVTLGSIRNNKVGLRLTSAGSGWCNENNFYGGRFDSSSSTNTTVSRNAVVISATNSFYNNNNVFHKPSFELAGQYLSGGATCVPVLIEYGQLNVFYDIRWEGSGIQLATISNSSYRNEFHVGYGFVGLSSITHAGIYKDSVVWSRTNRLPTSPMMTTVFNSGPLAKLANPYGASDIYIPGIHATSTGTAASFPNHTLSRINSEYLDVSATRLLGVFVSTTVQKRFIVRRDFQSTANPGRVVLRAYDLNGGLLGAGHIFGSDGYGWTYDAGYAGGSYYAASAVGDVFFAVSDFVYKVAVLVGSPDSGYTPMRSFSIDSIDGGSPAVWSGINVGDDSQERTPLATQSPVIWANAVARHLFRADPTSGGPLGWSRVFKASTTLSGAEAAGQTVISVASATGITSGDIVTIKLDNGDFHHTTVNGAPAGNDVTITDALPSGAASGNGFWAARWKAMANLA